MEEKFEIVCSMSDIELLKQKIDDQEKVIQDIRVQINAKDQKLIELEYGYIVDNNNKSEGQEELRLLTEDLASYKGLLDNLDSDTFVAKLLNKIDIQIQPSLNKNKSMIKRQSFEKDCKETFETFQIMMKKYGLELNYQITKVVK